MPLNVEFMSAAKLKSLKTGESISIRYARSQLEISDGASRVILDRFPKRVATTFSTAWAALFPTVYRIGPSNLCHSKRTSVTIVGGSLDTIRIILRWVLSCCDGHGIQSFPYSTVNPFTEYYAIKECADNMGIQLLSQEMSLRLNKLASRQIHSEDIRAMYLRMPDGHPILQDLARHIADLVWVRKLRAVNVYKTLREEFPQLDRYVNTVLEEKATMSSQQEKASRAKHTKSDSYGHCQKQHGENSTDNSIDDGYMKIQALDISSTSAILTADDKARRTDSLSQGSIRCPVVRKAKNGRPVFVRLPLDAVGIGENDFIGHSFTSFFPTGSTPKSVNNKTKSMATSEASQTSKNANKSRVEAQKLTKPAISGPCFTSFTTWATNEVMKNELGGNLSGRKPSMSSTHSSISEPSISPAESVGTVTTASFVIISSKSTSLA